MKRFIACVAQPPTHRLGLPELVLPSAAVVAPPPTKGWADHGSRGLSPPIPTGSSSFRRSPSCVAVPSPTTRTRRIQERRRVRWTSPAHRTARGVVAARSTVRDRGNSSVTRTRPGWGVRRVQTRHRFEMCRFCLARRNHVALRAKGSLGRATRGAPKRGSVCSHHQALRVERRLRCDGTAWANQLRRSTQPRASVRATLGSRPATRSSRALARYGVASAWMCLRSESIPPW